MVTVGARPPVESTDPLSVAVEGPMPVAGRLVTTAFENELEPLRKPKSLKVCTEAAPPSAALNPT